MNEMKNSDVKENKSPAVENYKNIKPEKEMPIKELLDAVKSELNKAAEEVKTVEGSGFDKVAEKVKAVEGSGFDKATEEVKPEGQENTRLDDNGTKYREGDCLLPDTEFEIKGYKYKTDDKGRTVSAEGKLRLCDSDYTRSMEEVKKIDGQEYKSGDDRGHLIAHRFGGSDKLENLVPMDAKLNRNGFAKLENIFADAVTAGADVRLKVEPVYKSDSTRPDEFRISYSIDGEKDVVVFRNESEV